METKECVICLSEIVINDYYTLTCCRNDVHIYCLNDWINKNIAKKNISKCFICSQDNSIIETMVSYNSTTDNTYINNSINNDNNSINNSIIMIIIVLLMIIIVLIMKLFFTMTIIC
jgi:hypothetical protein